MTTDRKTDDYEIDSDLAGMDLALIHRWLSTGAFWEFRRSRVAVDTAARHSRNFAAFGRDGSQVAYARVATDYATFVWLCDVYVERDHRGCGLGTKKAAITKAAGQGSMKG